MDQGSLSKMSDGDLECILILALFVGADGAHWLTHLG
jgi:hypothetical protein